ncbi:MAG: hypothetical protein WC350_02585 [Candidatus Micrarchaeia archaeon]|jgi:hypothetical protein
MPSNNSPEKSRQLSLLDESGPKGLRSTPPPLTARYGSTNRVPREFFFPEGDVTLERIVGAMQSWKNNGIDGFKRAYAFHRKLLAAEGKPRLREDGTLYEQHPARVALRMAIVGGGSDIVTPAYLHDITEDFDVPPERLGEFGHIVTPRVSLLTKGRWNPDVSPDWIYPENPAFYTMEDLYEPTMYAMRARSYNDRLLDAGDISVVLIKAADHLDNLMHWDKAKQQRNVETMLNNVLAILMRMLAWEDVQALVKFIRENVKLEVPEGMLVQSKSWVERHEPRDIILRKGLKGMLTGLQIPRSGQANIYGASAKYALPLGWCEVGLPNDRKDYLKLLTDAFSPDYSVIPVESKLPPGMPASEQMFRVFIPRDEAAIAPYGFAFDERTARLTLSMGEKRFRLMLHTLDREFIIEDPALDGPIHDIEARCHDIVSRVRDFHTKYILPGLEANSSIPPQ